MNKPIFKIGQKVKFKNENIAEFGEVLSINFDGEKWVYKIKTKEFDNVNKKFFDGFRAANEDELEAVKEIKNA